MRELPALADAELDESVAHPHPYAKTKLLALFVVCPSRDGACRTDRPLAPAAWACAALVIHGAKHATNRQENSRGKKPPNGEAAENDGTAGRRGMPTKKTAGYHDTRTRLAIREEVASPSGATQADG
jgi:hypothetical protein